MVAISEPILPKSSGVTMPSSGPITMPTSISTSTSGILVLPNCIDRKCAKNSIRPIIRMVVDICSFGWLAGADYTRQSLPHGCTSRRPGIQSAAILRDQCDRVAGLCVNMKMNNAIITSKAAEAE